MLLYLNKQLKISRICCANGLEHSGSLTKQVGFLVVYKTIVNPCITKNLLSDVDNISAGGPGRHSLDLQTVMENGEKLLINDL